MELEGDVQGRQDQAQKIIEDAYYGYKERPGRRK